MMLILVNLFSMKRMSYGVEGFDQKKEADNDNAKDKKVEYKKDKLKRKVEDKVKDDESDVDSSNVKNDEHFEVGRAKNGSSKIDYAATIENAYDDLNKIIGSEGMKSLTDDTQRLMKQQMELTESMKGMGSVVEKLMPMADSLKGMMKSMDANGMNDMIKKAQTSLGGTAKK